MRYYPKLKIFKSSTGNNQFDGVEARSYQWHVYAHVMLNGEVIETEGSYSNTTSKHIGEFWSLVGYKTKSYKIKAPRGLQDLCNAERSIREEIAQLRTELMNPRNRARDRRVARIAELEAMAPVVEMLKADRKARADAEFEAYRQRELEHAEAYNQHLSEVA